MIKWLLAVFALLSATLTSIAQYNDYAYVYIEGDKETPFYVKMEGKMMPRLAQHYAVLANLDAGVTNIEILFQQNKYAPVKFAIKVPKNGARGMVLRRVDDNFVLYDLQTGKYIFSGNKPAEDNIDLIENKYYNNKIVAQNIQSKKLDSEKEIVAKVVEKKEIKEETLPPFSPNKKPEQPKSKANPKKVKPSPKENISDNAPKPKTKVLDEATEAPNLAPTDGQKKYLDQVIINNDGQTNAAHTTTSAIPPNTDCASPMSDTEFESLLAKIKSKDDEDKIKFINKQKKHCFTTEQISYIGRAISSTSGRMQVLKQLYAQTTDPQNYHLLEHLFKTDFLKKKFRENIQNP